jgi:hypothetical protein
MSAKDKNFPFYLEKGKTFRKKEKLSTKLPPPLQIFP